MKNIVFRSEQFKDRMKLLGKVVLVFLTLTIVSLGLAFGITYMMQGATSNIFELKSRGDWVTLLVWLVAGIGSIFYLGFMIKNKQIGKDRWVYQLVAVFLTTIFLSTIYPLFFSEKTVNAEAVKKVVNNTYGSYYLVFGLLVSGYIVSLIISKNKLKQSNWTAFFLAIPYIVIGWKAQRAFLAFKELVLMKSFKENLVAQMVKDTHGEIRMINSLWYDLFTVLVITLVFVIGVRISETVWKKTSKQKAG